MSSNERQYKTSSQEIALQTMLSYRQLFIMRGQVAAIKSFVVVLLSTFIFTDFFSNLTYSTMVFSVVLFFVFAFYDSFKYKWLGKWILEQREKIKEKDKNG